MKALYPFCAIALLALRVFWADAPLERDEALYAVIAREILHGKLLYRDFWDHKPPGIHYLFSVFLLLIQDSQFGLMLGCWICDVFTLIATVKLTRAVGSSAAGSIVGAFAWVIMAADPQLDAHHPNTESFINLCCTWSLYLLCARRQAAWAAGGFGALSSCFKQIGIVQPLAFLIGSSLGKARELRAAATTLVLFLAIWGLACGVLLGVFYLAGGLEALWQDLVVYNRAYASGLTANILSLLQVDNFWSKAIYFYGAAIILGLIESIRRIRTHPEVLCLLIGSLLCIALPGRFYRHYYQLLAPWLCVSLALAASLDRRRTWLTFFSLLLPFSSVVWIIGVVGAEEWSLQRHGERFLEARAIGLNLRGKRFLYLGNDPSVYFYAGERPTFQYVSLLPGQFGPDRDKVWAAVAQQIEMTARPLLVINTDTPRLEKMVHDSGRWQEIGRSTEFAIFSIIARSENRSALAE